MQKTMKISMLGCVLMAASMGASCPSTGGLPVPVGSLTITNKIRTACSTMDGNILEDAYLNEQLILVDALKTGGSSKIEAVSASLTACLDRIELPCEVVDCAFEEDLPLKVNCMECAKAIADQIYGD